MRILVLDSALARRTAAMVVDDKVVAVLSEDGRLGHESALPVMARKVMAGTGAAIDLVAVTVGPGSFTGIRACLALAHGIGLASGVPVIGVTVGEAMRDAFPHLGSRALWVATDSRRGYIFLEHGASIVSIAVEDVPQPAGRVAIAGGAAPAIAARLAARGENVLLTDARFPAPRHIAAVAQRRHDGSEPPRPAQPVYVDPPDAKLPAGGLRPPPAAD